MKLLIIDMKKYTKGKVNLYLGDNMEFMAKLPDNYYDLAVVDPPYGGNDAVALKNDTKHKAGKRKKYK